MICCCYHTNSVNEYVTRLRGLLRDNKCRGISLRRRAIGFFFVLGFGGSPTLRPLFLDFRYLGWCFFLCDTAMKTVHSHVANNGVRALETSRFKLRSSRSSRSAYL